MEEKNKEEKEEKKKEEEKEEEKMKQQQPKNKKGLLVLMRHSLRVDKNAHAKWVDKLSRPYDSPIENTIILPRKQTKNIINNVFVDNNIGVGFDVVYVSPFRRCLQTAGVVIKEMIDIYKERGEKHKTPKIIIDKDLGERGVDVRRCEREVWGEGKEGDGRIQYLTKEKELEILREWSGGEIKEIEKERGEGPRGGEEAREGTERFMKRLREIKEKESQKGKKVLVVGHGDMVDGGVRAFLNEVVYIAEECCWVGLGVDEEGEVEKVGGEGFESMVL